MLYILVLFNCLLFGLQNSQAHKSQDFTVKIEVFDIIITVKSSRLRPNSFIQFPELKSFALYSKYATDLNFSFQMFEIKLAS